MAWRVKEFPGDFSQNLWFMTLASACAPESSLSHLVVQCFGLCIHDVPQFPCSIDENALLVGDPRGFLGNGAVNTLAKHFLDGTPTPHVSCGTMANRQLGIRSVIDQSNAPQSRDNVLNVILMVSLREQSLSQRSGRTRCGIKQPQRGLPACIETVVRCNSNFIIAPVIVVLRRIPCDKLLNAQHQSDTDRFPHGRFFRFNGAFARRRFA